MLAASQPFNSLDFHNKIDSYESYLEIQKEETLEDICSRPPIEYLRKVYIYIDIFQLYS